MISKFQAGNLRKATLDVKWWKCLDSVVSGDRTIDLWVTGTAARCVQNLKARRCGESGTLRFGRVWSNLLNHLFYDFTESCGFVSLNVFFPLSGDDICT